MSDDLSSLGDFTGTARLFPLPNLVLFPHVIQPLHVFEPRYRQLAADALAGDRLLSVVLLRPGWEADYEGRPPIHRVACLGKVVADQRLDDGRYNLLVRGLGRIRILDELATGKPYRSARAELLPEGALPPPEAEADFRARLGGLVPRWFPGQSPALEQFRRLLDSGLPAGTLADIFGFALPLDLAFKQQLLEQLDVGRRTRALIDYLEAHAPPEPTAAADRKFPPEFSPN
jgi:Lon protease-like protein